MNIANCPLCGGKITGGRCPDCGYFIVNEQEISAIYKLDPPAAEKKTEAVSLDGTTFANAAYEIFSEKAPIIPGAKPARSEKTDIELMLDIIHESGLPRFVNLEKNQNIKEPAFSLSQSTGVSYKPEPAASAEPAAREVFPEYDAKEIYPQLKVVSSPPQGRIKKVYIPKTPVLPPAPSLDSPLPAMEELVSEQALSAVSPDENKKRIAFDPYVYNKNPAKNPYIIPDPPDPRDRTGSSEPDYYGYWMELKDEAFWFFKNNALKIILSAILPFVGVSYAVWFAKRLKIKEFFIFLFISLMNLIAFMGILIG